MAITTPIQTIISESSDSTLSKIYASNLQGIPAIERVSNVYINQTQEYVTNYYNVDKASGSDTQVQFNSGSKLAADAGLTYNATTDSLTVAGNVTSGNILTNHLLYANGNAWTFSTYGNSNVATYIPTYTGNLSPGNLTVSTNANLGAVGHVTITGGTNGQVLTTNGSGSLSWSTVSGSSFDGGTISGSLFISNSTSSTNYNNGALKVTGGVGIGGDMHVLGHIASDTTIYAGHLSDFGSWSHPVFIGRDAGTEYIQGALVNTDSNGSADWIAYNDLSDGDAGVSAWADMGFTGSTFNDANYTITKANDGYFFVEGIDALSGGNMVLATGGKGLNHDIVFATGGFATNREVARIIHNSTITQSQLHTKGSVKIDTFLKLTPGTAPVSPEEGTVYYDSATHKLKVYTGSGWETITSA